jgi:hypothetical protein
LHEDFDHVVDCLPDDLVATMGGRADIVAQMKKATAEGGWHIDSADITEPTAVVKGGNHWFAIVPETIHTRLPEGRVVLASFLLGVSADDGRSWRFVDGAKLTPESAKAMFADYPATLTLPAVGEPELQRGL